MTNDRVSGIALIAGSAAGLVTMGVHPTGAQMFAPGQLQHVAHVNVAAHALALASLPVLFLGALGLSRRLSLHAPLVSAALVTYAFALVAVMNAAIMDGLVNTAIAPHIGVGDPAVADGWRLLFNYTGFLNQAFARVFTVASSIALALWSVAILRTAIFSHAVGVYGCVLAPITVLAVVSGHLALDVHGFGAIVLSQALWYIIVGVQMYRAPAL
jgi:hypothetical protein